MNNEETLALFNQLINGKQIIIGKSRQVGKSSNTTIKEWKTLYDKYHRAQDRKETIKRLFNI